MDFVTSEYYTIFLPIVVVLVLFIGRQKREAQVLMMLTMSYVFFWLASGWHILLLLTSTLVDWTAGKKIHASNEQKIRKRWLVGSLTVNLGLLAIFKYLDFLIETWNLASLRFDGAPELDTFGLLLPVGISFYTFQTMSYTIDIYREKLGPYDRFLDFACYAAFFPQLVAGPIVRSQHFLEQIREPVSSNPHRFRLGLTLIIYGLAKKLIIADNVALHANAIFADGVPLDNIGLVWWGALCFGIQIYCDFSAYTDIALGSGHLIGIELPENFKSPYAAKSPQDFWRRWHISLSTWLRDYLYIPLGGSRGGTRVLIIALMGTMLLGGLWHGASWNFVIWGGLHGIFLATHTIIKRKFPQISLLPFFQRNTGRIFSVIATQYLVFFTFISFRVQDFDHMWYSMQKYVLWDFATEQIVELVTLNKFPVILIIIFFILNFASYKHGNLPKAIANIKLRYWFSFLGSVLMLVLIFETGPAQDFIYFKF